MSLGDRKAISEKAYSTVVRLLCSVAVSCVISSALSYVTINHEPLFHGVDIVSDTYVESIAQRCHTGHANQLISAEWTNLQRGIVADWAGFAPVDE